MADSSPTQIGSYRVLGLLGQNRWYESYLAAHLTTEHKVVIKLFSFTPSALNSDRQKHFAWQLATLLKHYPNHPHLVGVEYVGSHNYQPYLVLDYMPGGNLAELIQNQAVLQQQLPIAEVWYILKGIAKALDHLHEQGVVHGHVEPENILFDEEGEPCLSHPELLNLLDYSAYTSPEQQTTGHKNRQDDVYSLVAVAYVMLTGIPPAVSNPKSITDLRPDLPQTFKLLFKYGLAQRAEERFHSAGAFVKAFEQALNLPKHLLYNTFIMVVGLGFLLLVLIFCR